VNPATANVGQPRAGPEISSSFGLDILLTGAAGFIGYHVAMRLLARGQSVIGVDNLNDCYDPLLKRARIRRLVNTTGFILLKQMSQTRPQCTI
jgi:nucleoside-diphosphate-sugar epimerase